MFSPHRKWCNSASSLKTMDSYAYRPIYLGNWWACKWLESATMNIAQLSVRSMPSGWINSNTGLSSVRGSIYLHSLSSRAGDPWPGEKGQQPLQGHPNPGPLRVASPPPREWVQPFGEIKCCSSQQYVSEFLIQSLHRLLGSPILAFVHLTYRKCPGKKRLKTL